VSTLSVISSLMKISCLFECILEIFIFFNKFDSVTALILFIISVVFFSV
jgi:hypothetical protein